MESKPTPEKIRAMKDDRLRQRSGLKTEQNTDQEFFDDIFPTRITDPYIVRRTGVAAEIITRGANFINTTNPKVFREPRADNTTEVERTSKIGRMANHWVDFLIGQIRETTFNGLLLGESYWQIQYNPAYNDNSEHNLPILFSVPDPRIILPSLSESMDGIPEDVIKFCTMSPSQVGQLYPQWNNPQNKKDDGKVDYLAYFDKDWRYFEADGQALTKGVEPNALKFVPFVHIYSGFGKHSPEGNPESRIVGKLRYLRNLLTMECEMTSMIDSIIALFANPVLILKALQEGIKITEEDKKSVALRPGGVVTIPTGWDYEIRQGDVPAPQLFQHLYQIRARLQQELPPIAFGMPSTSRATGRQEDVYQGVFGKQYAPFVHNIEAGLSTVLGMGLRILDTIPKILPITNRVTMWKDGQEVRQTEKIEKKDIDGYYDLNVRLDPDEAIEASRNAMLYKGYWESGLVDKKTVLMEGLKKTNDEADKIINKRIADDYIMTNPVMGEAISRKAVELSGMGDILRQMDMQMAAQGVQGAKKPRPSEAQSVDSDVIKQMLQEQPYGARESPELEGI